MALSKTYHYDTYREELGKAYPAFGHALWEPNPGDNPPVEVGDVGFIRAGKFHRLFNALLPRKHPSHKRRGVPEYHEQLQPHLRDHIDHGNQDPINFHSHGITVISGGFEVLAQGSTNAAKVSFSCTKKQGAVLALPVPTRRQDTITLAHFRKWISTHIDSWFAFTEKLQLGIEMEDIILVTGFHRTRSWSNVSFNEVLSNAKFSLGVEVPGTVGASVNWQASKLRLQGAVHNQGPSGENLPENQCIFIRGYRVTRRVWLLPRRIEAAAEPKPDPRGDDREPEMEVVPISNVTEYREPLHVLLEYIAKLAPHCDMALVHDDDLDRVLGVGDSTSLENLQPDVMMGYLEKSKPEIASISYPLPANDRTSRIETGHTTVAMLSAELKSLATTDHPSSVPLLSHLSVGTTARDREENVGDDAPGYPPELAPPAAFPELDVNVHGSDGLPRYSQTEDPTPTRSGDEKRVDSLPPSTQSTLQPTSSLGRLTSPLRTAPQQGIGHDTPPPYSSAYSDIRPAMSQSSAPHPTPQTLPSKKTSYNLEATFNAALKAYKKRTKKDLISHPLTAQLQACDSPSAILAILQSQAAQFGSSPGGDEKLTMWLDPVVNVLYAFSAVLGEGDIPQRASLANVVFAGVGILLLAAKDVPGSQDSLEEISGRIEICFNRLDIYTGIPQTPTMTDKSVEITVELLDILAISTKEIKQSRMKKFLKKVAGRMDLEDGMKKLEILTDEWVILASVRLLKITHTIDEKLRGIGGQVKDVDENVQGVDGEVVIKDDVSNVKDKVQIIIDDGKKARAAVREMKSIPEQMAKNGDEVNRAQLRASLKSWQSPPDPSTNYFLASSRRDEGTAEWFLESGAFERWKVTGSLLWVHGKPGSGKSVLCSALIDNIRAMCENGPASLAYFYFDTRDIDKQSRHNLLSSLLTQLSARSDPFCDILSRLYRAHGDGERQPSDRALMRCLKEMLTLPDHGPVYLIIDALDECPNTSGIPSPRDQVLDLIVGLVELSLPSFHLCVTSRPEIDIRVSLEPLAARIISLHDEIGQKADIDDYLRSVVYSYSSVIMRRWRDEDKDLVFETLSEKADGMFRWVFCQLERLKNCLPPSLPYVLTELPKTLDETYAHVLKGIREANRSQARRLFQCLAVAMRPLRVEELAGLLALNFDDEGTLELNMDWQSEDQEQAVLATCSSLIDIVFDDVSHTRVVQFAHFSVKEFLTSDRLATSHEDFSYFHISLEPAHTTITQACLAILLQLDDGLDIKRVQRHFPLAEYAAQYWVDHAGFRNVALRAEDGMRRLFDPDRPYFAAWLHFHDIDDGWDQFRDYRKEPRGSPLYYASLCGFRDLAQFLIVCSLQDVDTRGGLNHSPLVATLYRRHFDVAELLHKHGAAVDVRGYERQTPLHAASADGLADIVRWLLDHGADADSVQDGLATPLNMAAANGRLVVVRMLLGCGVDVDAANDDDHTPLHLASENGHLDTVRLLLVNGANTHAGDWSQSTPLHLASFGGSAETVRLLIEHGADVNAQNESHSTPLHLASSGGQTETVRLLIDHGADVGAQDESHSTPLHLASSGGQVGTMQLLIERGADVNAQDKDHSTPLHLASSTGNAEAAQLLLEHGADVGAQDKSRSTPLFLASSVGSAKTVRLLIEHGAGFRAER